MEITAESIATEVKNSVDAVKNDMATVQASVDALRTEVKNAASATSAERKSAAVAALETKSAELAAFTSGNRVNIEVKAGADMLTAGTIGASQVLIATGSAVMTPSRLTHLRDFMNIGRLKSPVYKYDREVAVVGAPGITLEGAKKPQYQFQTVPVTANAAKIAGYYKLSDELLADAPALAQSFENRGVELTLIEEDMQLLYGTGTSGNLQGIMPLATPFDAGTLKVTNAQDYDVLRAAIAQVRKSQYRANAILMNPTNVAEMELTKDNEGRYILPAIFGSTPSSISRVTILEVDAINEGEFLVGAFDMGVNTFMVQDLNVAISNQNEDDFVTNKVTVRIEERLIQAVVRPSAFVKGTFAAAKIALT
ncbi:phage major capsid protein [Hymenobacter sp. UYCo722]|uniref:phage major capsid protein n=1 Tax=Hymenobacter sp. UYCo722 TaxID=3156335 RepID=UPI00339B3937